MFVTEGFTDKPGACKPCKGSGLHEPSTSQTLLEINRGKEGAKGRGGGLYTLEITNEFIYLL